MATGTINKIKSLRQWQSISLPFTATTDGEISILIRATAEGRLYMQFNSSPSNSFNPYFCDGYQSAQGYCLTQYLVPKGTTLSIKSSSNVSASSFYWLPIY